MCLYYVSTRRKLFILVSFIFRHSLYLVCGRFSVRSSSRWVEPTYSTASSMAVSHSSMVRRSPAHSLSCIGVVPLRLEVIFMSQVSMPFIRWMTLVATPFSPVIRVLNWCRRLSTDCQIHKRFLKHDFHTECVLWTCPALILEMPTASLWEIQWHCYVHMRFECWTGAENSTLHCK